MAVPKSVHSVYAVAIGRSSTPPLLSGPLLYVVAIGGSSTPPLLGGPLLYAVAIGGSSTPPLLGGSLLYAVANGRSSSPSLLGGPLLYAVVIGGSSTPLLLNVVEDRSSSKNTILVSKKSGRGSGSVLGRLKDSLICGIKRSLGDDDSNERSGASTGSLVHGKVHPNVDNGGSSPHSSDSPHVAIPEKFIRHRKFLASPPTGSVSGSIFTPTSSSSKGSCRSVGSMRHIGRSPLGRPPLPKVSGSGQVKNQRCDRCRCSSSGSPGHSSPGLTSSTLSSPGPSSPESSSQVTRRHSRSSSSGSVDLSSICESSPLKTKTTSVHRSSSSGSITRGSSRSSSSGSITSSSVRHSRSSSSGSITSSSMRSTSDTPVIPKVVSVETPQKSVELPHGNIFRRGVPMGNLTREAPRNNVMRSEKASYGYGSIIGRIPKGKLPGSRGDQEPETWMNEGYAEYVQGNLDQAIWFYSRAIEMARENDEFLCKRTEVYLEMGLVSDVVRSCDEALLLDRKCVSAHRLMGKLLIRLGQVKAARIHLSFQGVNPSEAELKTLKAIEKHIGKCIYARKNRDWGKALDEAEAAMDSGACDSPQLFACRAECHLKLRQLDEADSYIARLNEDNQTPHCSSDDRFFDMLSEAYPLFVMSEVSLASGRFGDAAVLAKKAMAMEPDNAELIALVNIVQGVSRARNRGNELLKSDKLTEASAAYDEGLTLEQFNTTLRSKRAFCSLKLEKWEQCINDCTVLLSDPTDYRALGWRAFSYFQLEKWTKAVEDYQVLQQKFPINPEYIEALSRAQDALRKAREVEQKNLDLEQFRAILSSPD
ncbi:hypothetical protein Droror1_Dr00021552 [Drosera rotundifolia]